MQNTGCHNLLCEIISFRFHFSLDNLKFSIILFILLARGYCKCTFISYFKNLINAKNSINSKKYEINIVFAIVIIFTISHTHTLIWVMDINR